MNQQGIAPAAKRSPLLPLAVGLLAVAAYVAGIVTTSLVGSATPQSPVSGGAAPLPAVDAPAARSEFRIEHGPTEFDD